MTAEDLMHLCDRRNKAHRGAWKAGAAHALAGGTRSACPYNRNATGGRFGNIPTGERGFARAWLAGYDAAAVARKKESSR